MFEGESSSSASSSSPSSSPSSPTTTIARRDSHSEEGRSGYEVGLILDCTWRSGEVHPGKIVGKKRRLPKEGGGWMYYIHFLDFNKRLDEWVTSDRLKPYPVEPQISRNPTTPEMGRRRSSLKRGASIVDQCAEDELAEDFKKASIRCVELVQLGRYEIEAWYFSPYPQEYHGRQLYLCEFCLKYMKEKATFVRHRSKCELRYPPGDEIYRSGDLSFFEVDGAKNQQYCQNLCLLAKLFLDHKTLESDVEPFLFYILTTCDDYGCHIVGYFSKQKNSEENYNLACILTLPPYQRRGYGRILIEFSYELSKLEGKAGTPEKPLSDLGWLSYRSYWTNVLLEVLRQHKDTALSINDITKMTAILQQDIINTFQQLRILKYGKGKHIISIPPSVMNEHTKVCERSKGHVHIDPDLIVWSP